mgnify:FL=1
MRAWIIALLVSFFLIPATVQAQLVTSPYHPNTRLTVQVATPYDNGVVVVAQNGSTLYIYFLNSTEQRLIYSLNLSSLFSGFPVFGYSYEASSVDGYLYIEIEPEYAIFAPSGQSVNGGSFVVQNYVLVFKGLHFVKGFYLDSCILVFPSPPLDNVDALQFLKFFIYGGVITSLPIYPYINTTIVLNNTNITVPGGTIAALKLRNGIFIASVKTLFTQFGQEDVLYVAFSNGSGFPWIRTYTFGPVDSSPGLTLWPGLWTVAGGQLFLVSYQNVSYSYANHTAVSERTVILGINVSTGMVSTKIELHSTAPVAGLMDINNELYVLQVSNIHFITEQYVNGTLRRVAQVPIEVVSNATYYGPVTALYYDPGYYLLIMNPAGNGTNVAVVNSRNVTSYVVGGKVISVDHALLVRNGNNLTLIPLDSYGMPVKEIQLGRTIENYTWAKVLASAHGYYVVVANSSKIAEYAVPFNLSGQYENGMSSVSAVANPTPNLTLPVLALTTAAIATVIIVALLSRRK